MKSLTLGISWTIDLVTTECNASVGPVVLKRRFGICSKGLLVGLFGALALVMSSGAWGQSVLFTFGPNVPADQQQLVRDAIASGHEFFQSRLGTTVTRTTNVFVFDDIELLVDAYMEFLEIPSSQRSIIVDRWTNDCHGEAGFGYIFQCTGHPDWDTDAFGFGLRNQRIKFILHEYIHVLQFDLAGPQPDCCQSDQVSTIGPAWLVEGTAEYLNFLFFGDQGVLDFRRFMQGQQDFAKSISASLRELETQQGLRSEAGRGALAVVAVDFAVSLAELRALVDFWQAIGGGASWQTAFNSSFGLSIDEFYQEFETFRSQGVRRFEPAMITIIKLLLLDDD